MRQMSKNKRHTPRRKRHYRSQRACGPQGLQLLNSISFFFIFYRVPKFIVNEINEMNVNENVVLFRLYQLDMSVDRAPLGY